MSIVRQHPLIWVFVKILVFQKSPDVVPASGFLLGLLLVMNLVVGIISFVIQYDLAGSILRTIVDMVISIGFVYLVLLLLNKSSRAMQTISAMLGVSIILNLLSLPMLILMSADGIPTGVSGTFLYIIFCWHIAVMGHIFRHALSVGIFLGMSVSFAYVVFAMAVFYSLFPVQ